MSYEGGYQQQQRPYVGPAAQRPSPAPGLGPGPGHYQHPPRPRYDGEVQQQQQQQQQQYHDYQPDYIYDYYDDGGGGYGPDPGGEHQDPGYDRGPPPDQRYTPQQGPYGPGPNGPGRGARPPMGLGRGGPGPGPGSGPMPQARAGTADGVRGGPYPTPRGGGLPPGPGRVYPNGPPPGRGGRPAPFQRAPNSDPPPNRNRPPMNDSVRSPGDPGFGGNPFPPFPGHQRGTDFEDERHMAGRMAGMNISQRPPLSTGRESGSSQRSAVRSPEGDYNRPSADAPRGPPRGWPQGYDGRPGGPGPTGPGYGPPVPADYGLEHDDGSYGPGPAPGPGEQGAPGEYFGPPSRSMTMPVNDGMQRRGPMQPPQRMDSMPYAPPPGHRMPPRPSTSQGNRPLPQRMYPSHPGNPPPGAYGGPEYEEMGPGGPSQHTRASFDANFDAYSSPPASGPPDMPNFRDGPPQPSRASLDLHMKSGLPAGPAPNGAHPPAAHRGPDMMRTKSQPDLRKQVGPYEMASDAPPMPMPMPQNGFQPGPGYPPSPYGGPGGLGQPGVANLGNMGRRPSAGGLPNNPATMRSGGGGGGGMQRGPSPPQSNNPDALPSHPTPVRPGLMADSMVSVASNRPPPVRNYGTPPPAAAPSVSGGPPSGNPTPQPQPQPQPQQAPVTADELERLRVIVKTDPNDQETALRLAKRLVEASDVLVPNVADPKTRSRARERYLVDAHKILKKLASAQNMEGMFFFADSLGRGLFGSEPDNKEAFTLYQSAAKMGHAGAAYRTAVCCEIGHEEGGGTRKDPLKAIQWYKRAATLGDTPAMYKMGMIQLKGLLGQPKNPREAVGWLKRAAERADAENPHALHELGLLYESAQPNDAILRDEQYAFSLFRKAAELGYKFSQFRLGCAYEYGLMGCPIDPRLSIMWYSKAATQQEHQSELALSGWYLTGTEGVLGQSDTEAYLWARKAAMAGLAKAEYAMGYFTEVGIGVPANMEDAKRWYWRAAAQDFPKARERLEDLKRTGKNGPRQRERISRSKIGRQQEGECTVM